MYFTNNSIDLRKIKTANEKKLFILVGPPSVGKSTWTQQNAPDAFIISRDDIVNEVAAELGLTYDDMFNNPDKSLPIGHQDTKYGTVIARPDYLPKFLPEKVWDKITKGNGYIHKKFMQSIEDAKTSGKDIVVDMTNMNKNSRSNMLNNFKDISGYKRYVVNFNFEGDDVKKSIKEIAKKRAKEIQEQGGSKTIPEDVLDKMFSSYQKPSLEEGFDEIIDIDDRQRILNQGKI